MHALPLPTLPTAGETEVMIQLAECEITSQTYTEIVCVTGLSGALSADVGVTVTNSLGTKLPASCDTGSDCAFAYDAAATPTLDSIDAPVGVSGLQISSSHRWL